MGSDVRVGRERVAEKAGRSLKGEKDVQGIGKQESESGTVSDLSVKGISVLSVKGILEPF